MNDSNEEEFHDAVGSGSGSGSGSDDDTERSLSSADDNDNGRLVVDVSSVVLDSVPEPKQEKATQDADIADEVSRAERREESERAWMSDKKNVLIFSRAGKPIFSSNEDELELSSVFSLMQAMLAKTDNRLRIIRAGNKFVMVFAVRGPILLVIFSRLEEPVGYLQLQLEYLYAQILFHFTLSALNDTFRRKPGYDLRGLLGGAQTELEGILEMARTGPSLLLEAVPCLHLSTDVRTAATNILYSAKQPNLLYAILFADDKLVCHVSPKKHPLKSSDLLLLLNFVDKAKQLRTQETWTPLCLPAFNSTGFLHAYAAYVSQNICLLLLSSGESLEQFHFCSDAKKIISEQLASTGTSKRIEASVTESNLTPGSCDAASSIHLIYRSLKYDQYFETSIANHASLHGDDKTRERLMSRYVNISERLHSYKRNIDLVASETPSPASPGKQTDSTYSAMVEQGEIWDVRESEGILAVVNPSQYEIYASFHIFTSASQAMACVTRFAAWVRNAKHDLFMARPPIW